MEFDIEECEIVLSKHFRRKYARKWGLDYSELRKAIRGAYRLEKMGKTKYEAYYEMAGKSIKIIFAYSPELGKIIIISGAEGT